MSVCRKHRKQGRTACACRITSGRLSDGYGGPDVSDLSDAVFTALIVNDVTDNSSSYGYSDSGSSSSSSYGSSSSYDSGSSSSSYGSSSSSSYDSGSSSSSSDSSW